MCRSRRISLLLIAAALFLFVHSARAEGGATLPFVSPLSTPLPGAYEPASTQGLEAPVYADDSLVYYFYRPDCPYCRDRADMLLHGLPEYIDLPDGSVSRVVLVTVNKSDPVQGELIRACYHAREIGEDRQLVPAVLIGGAYLCGTEEIREHFLTMLCRGDGLATPLMNGGARETADFAVEGDEEAYARRLDHLFTRHMDYLDRTIVIEGWLYQGRNDALDMDDYACVYRWGPNCCGEGEVMNGLEVAWVDRPGERLQDGAWVRATGKLERYERSGYLLMRVVLSDVEVLDSEEK